MSQPSIEGVKTGLRLEKCTLCNHPPLGACNGEMVSSLFLLLYLYRQAKEREKKKTSAISSQFTLRKVCEMPKSIWNMSRLDYFFFHEKSKKKKKYKAEKNTPTFGG